MDPATIIDMLTRKGTTTMGALAIGYCLGASTPPLIEPLTLLLAIGVALIGLSTKMSVDNEKAANGGGPKP